ncbi:hypothetical protein ACFV3E_42695 [Streptomyces sp. NPDC059718]
MNSPTTPLAGIAAGLPAVLAGALGRAPWWAVGAIVIASCLAVPVTAMVLDHIRQRKGNLVDEKFAAALDEIHDPEKKIQAIISYRLATASTTAPQPPPDPPPGNPRADLQASGQEPATT